LSEKLGLPCPHPASVDSARNKHATRAALKAAGLPTPRNMLIQVAADVPKAQMEVGFPAVLKPVSGAASLGVKKVSNPAELLSCYEEIVAELSTLVVTSGALVKGDANNVGADAGSLVDLTILMEQYLDGPEVDVDVVMSGGQWVYAAVADNGPTMEPYFNETWGLCPSLLPMDQQRQLKELSVNSLKALGFTMGVFHVECKMTSTGPQLIEVNARMGGGQVHECNLRCWGVDLVEETLFLALGIPARPPVPKQPLSAAAYCYVNAPQSGTVKDLSKLEKMQSRQDVVWAKPLTKPGAAVTGPQDGLPTWLCDLFVVKPKAKDALDFLQQLEAEEPVPVAP
jgi:biotin carboxylase